MAWLDLSAFREREVEHAADRRTLMPGHCGIGRHASGAFRATRSNTVCSRRRLVRS